MTGRFKSAASSSTMKHVSHYGRLDRHTGTGGLGQGEQAGDSPGDRDALAHAQKDRNAQ